MAIEPLPYRVAKKLLECLCAELAANAIADPDLKMPARCCLRAGAEIPFDITDSGEDLCCRGEAYVKIVDFYPSQLFPEPDQPTANACQLTRFTLALELGVLRCIPDLPTCEESDFAMRRMMADGEAAYRAACCWGAAMNTATLPTPVPPELPSLGRKGTRWFAGPWTPGGPDGLCLPATMGLFVSLPGPAACC